MNKKRKRREAVDLDTRLAIKKYLEDGYSVLEIAHLIGRHHNVVYYELKKRCQKDGTYDPIKAHKMAKEAKKMSEQDKLKMSSLNNVVKKYIEEKLALKWSPRQISSEMKNDIGYSVSYSTIYKYIKEGQVKVNKAVDMRQGGKKYNKTTEQRGKLKIGEHRQIRFRSTTNNEP
ncbi:MULTISPECIES: helix-turn-helix domain-containing protein [Staphylococcus]|uniref:helix-turn-helix domain-containing protein n=1 Tax=Staphylococcus TaxID=1279 RepID=UPI0005C7D47F|nr:MULTISPECIES: helix-turn-helix domain-containing protein [Staphylococcus]MDG4944202.1 helix-turn-helix domain-containing protein [Staphylococcus agnetis]HDH6082987.1 helix-turn-helix domain-containing protein [Staphylococcus aureus]